MANRFLKDLRYSRIGVFVCGPDRRALDITVDLGPQWLKCPLCDHLGSIWYVTDSGASQQGTGHSSSFPRLGDCWLCQGRGVITEQREREYWAFLEQLPYESDLAQVLASKAALFFRTPAVGGIGANDSTVPAQTTSQEGGLDRQSEPFSAADMPNRRRPVSVLKVS